MTSFSIWNFGCRVNQAESFDWTVEFQRLGWRFEEEASRGDVVILNTCTLTSRADRDARKTIRKISRENPGARILVTGCLAERDPRGLEAIPGVWRVVPNTAKAGLLDLISSMIGPEKGPAPGGLPPASYRSRALVKIQDGCDMACRFCVIPSVRGRSASRPVAEVLDRVERWVSEGFREIVLAGIHLCSYGRDLSPRSSLLELLRRIDLLAGDFRVRLTSLDPRLLPAPLIEHLSASPRIAPHFHLSLQSGSDRILAAMGRGSTAAGYRALAADFAARAPEANFGADVIVGFPGETEDDFRATVSLIEDIPLRYVHVFSYSPRPGTNAAEDRPVDSARVKERAARLRRLSRLKNLEYRRRFLGRVLDGVIIRRKRGGLEVLTPNYLAVAVPGAGVSEGSAVRVRIVRVGERNTEGEICDNTGLRP